MPISERRIGATRVYARVREHCRSKDGAVEDYPWGNVVWKVRGKLFAGASEGGNAFTVRSTRARQAVLVEHPAIEPAAYVGRFGWVTVTVTDRKTLELALELIDDSYASLAPKRRTGTRVPRAKRSE